MIKRIISSLFVIIFIFPALGPYVWGEEVEAETALIIETKGMVMVYRHQDQEWSVLKKGMAVFTKDILKTFSDSEVDLFIPGVAVVRLKENTRLELAEIEREATKPVTSSQISRIDKRPLNVKEKNILKLLKGKLLIWVKHIFPGSAFEVHTLVGVAGVRGTRFTVGVPDQDTTIVSVLEGIVEVKNIRIIPHKAVLVRGKEVSIIRGGAYPSKPRGVNEQEYKDLKEVLKLKWPEEREEPEEKSDARHRDGSSGMSSTGGHHTMPTSPMSPSIMGRSRGCR